MKIKVIKSSLLFVAIIFFTTVMTSCKKTSTANACYDEELFQKSKNLSCIQSCDGIIGCDGKKYCNDCEAAKVGIRVR